VEFSADVVDASCGDGLTCCIMNAKGNAMKALKAQVKIERPVREQVSREDALKRVRAFGKRKEKLVAALRKDPR
jgi:thermostable 8-oxoguanine DNA glycosylase